MSVNMTKLKFGWKANLYDQEIMVEMNKISVN